MATLDDRLDGAKVVAVAERLQHARQVVVMTGAGISAESGIPTFREAQTGLWARYRAEDLATPEAFERDPETVWRWYAWRRELVAKAAPNAGHHALVRIASLVPQLTLVTQNVDGLHQQAGSVDVIELHGSLSATICSRTRRPIDDDHLANATDLPPRSPHHREGLARPGVVWFGESLPTHALDAAMRATTSCDVFMSIGTSGLVEPAASFGRLAAERDACIVEINPAATPLTTAADYWIAAPAGEILPAIVDALRPSET